MRNICSNMVLLLVITIVCLMDLVTAVKAPKFIKPCTNFTDACMTNAVRTALPDFIKGIPELGMQSLDPFIIKKLDLTLPGGLSLQFRDGYSKGLKKCKVDFARINEDRDTLEIQVHCNLTIKGKYRSKGRLLMFPIDGDGDLAIKCYNIRLNVFLDLDTNIDEDGVKHLNVKNFATVQKYDGQVMYRMSNIFKGNPEISKLVLDFMNNNWLLIAQEFGKPLIDFGMSSVLENIKLLFSQIPMDQLV